MAVIGISMGDPAGIGPEVITKAFERIAKTSHTFIVIGDKSKLSGVPATIIDVPYATPGEGSLRFLNTAVNLIKTHKIHALVTAPLSKAAVHRYKDDFVGHTEFLAEAFSVKQFDMMFVSDKMRLSLLTRHVPLMDVPSMITKASVMAAIFLMDTTLKTRFGVAAPRIAVFGLNPHAGEEGLLGKEELKFIIPAIKATHNKGVDVQGPFPADTFFIADRGFDGIIAMYHDQGLAPLKGMYFKNLVNFTAGLPFVRTSPVHGTAYDIAGKGIADPSSMTAAIDLACALTS